MKIIQNLREPLPDDLKVQADMLGPLPWIVVGLGILWGFWELVALVVPH